MAKCRKCKLVTVSLSAQGDSSYCSRPVWCLSCSIHVLTAGHVFDETPFSPTAVSRPFVAQPPLGHFLHEQAFLIQSLQKVFSSCFLLVGLAVMFRFFVSRLRYTSHTIHFTHLPGPSEWFLVYSLSWATTVLFQNTFTILTRNSLSTRSRSPFPPNLLALGKHQAVFFLSLWICLYWTFHISGVK